MGELLSSQLLEPEVLHFARRFELLGSELSGWSILDERFGSSDLAHVVDILIYVFCVSDHLYKYPSSHCQASQLIDGRSF